MDEFRDMFIFWLTTIGLLDLTRGLQEMNFNKIRPFEGKQKNSTVLKNTIGEEKKDTHQMIAKEF
jgi:hypothetical protein